MMLYLTSILCNVETNPHILPNELLFVANNTGCAIGRCEATDRNQLRLFSAILRFLITLVVAFLRI